MSETLDEALQYAANDPIWLARPAQQHRYIKLLASEVKKLRTDNAEYASGQKLEFLNSAITKGLLHCERECATLKGELENVRAQIEQVTKALRMQDAEFENERYLLKAEIAQWRQKVNELEEKLAQRDSNNSESVGA